MSQAQQSGNASDNAQIDELAARKLEFMAQIHQLRAEIRKVDQQLVKFGTDKPQVSSVIGVW